VDLQKQVKLLTQKEAASSKQQKALEAQVERAKQAAAVAREAAAAKEQQVKELAKEGARVDKDRWGTCLVAAAVVTARVRTTETGVASALLNST
jgi:septal ring factor EnvC (AmiA/AmiB activator)